MGIDWVWFLGVPVLSSSPSPRAGCLVLEAYSVSHGKASAYLIDLLRSYLKMWAEDDERARRERSEFAMNSQGQRRRRAPICDSQGQRRRRAPICGDSRRYPSNSPLTLDCWTTGDSGPSSKGLPSCLRVRAFPSSSR